MMSLGITIICLIFGSVHAQFGPAMCTRVTKGLGTCQSSCQTGFVPHPQGTQWWMCGGRGQVCCEPAPAFDESNCGRLPPTRRILNGRNTTMCSWPFIVSIRYRIPGEVGLTQNTTQPSCAGVIIDNQWILTHAACCYIAGTLNQTVNDALVVAAEYNTNEIDLDPRNPDEGIEQFIRVSECFVNPGFYPINRLLDLPLDSPEVSNGNALALMKLERPINYYCASSVCLPSAPVLRDRGRDTYSQCMVLGWGFTNTARDAPDGTLKKGDVSTYKDIVCDILQYSIFANGPPRFFPSACQVSRWQCSTEQQNSACLGDQGGPVLCYDGFRYSVQGILPLQLCQDNVMNPYVIDVASATPWIYRTINDN